MGAEQGFAQLESSDKRPTADNLIVTPTASAVADGEVLLGLSLEGRRLLIPHPMRIKPRLDGSLAYTSRELDSPARNYLDVRCIEPALNSVFCAFVDHVLTQLTPDVDALVMLRRSADEWKQLFRAGRSLSSEEAIGLIGELDILARLAAVAPTPAWQSWKGPRGGVHDFMTIEADLEVKSTSALDGGGLTIHGLDQLDSDGRPLYLVVQRVREDSGAPSLDDRLDGLSQTGLPQFELLEVAARLGHRYRSGAHGDEHRYRVTQTRIFEVHETFPGLRRSRLSPDLLHGVSRVRFTLAADALINPRSDPFMQDLFKRMCA